MNERLHRVLDGELPSEELNGEERRELARLDAAIAVVAGRVRDVPVPDLVPLTMQRIATLAPESIADRPARPPSRGWRRGLRWLWTPRPLHLSLRPAWALVALALLGSLPFLLLDELRAPPATPTAATATSVFVQFRLDAPGASRVELAGSFTGWQPRHPLRQTSPGVWTVVVPLAPGVHDYTFVVDGRAWVPDPHAPQVPDSFGGTNSRITLLPPREAV